MNSGSRCRRGKSAQDLANSTCTNCGHVLEAGEIAAQEKVISGAAIYQMIEDAKALNRKYAGH
jgi:hypothetical protein